MIVLKNIKKMKKIKDKKNSKLFWRISGFTDILDGLTKILSLGFYCSDFALKYLIKYSNKNE